MSKTQIEVRQMLAAALEVTAKAKKQSDGEHSFSEHTVREIAQGKGILKGADQHPALPMTTKTAPKESEIVPLDTEWAAVDPEGAEEAYLAQWTNRVSHGVENARRAGLADGKQDKSARRMKIARARAARKQQFDEIAASPIKPNPERLGQAWMVVLPMSSIVEKMAAGKARWASRYLGTIVDDIPQQVIEAMVLILAKSDKDLALLARAACELGDETARTGRIPGEQLSNEERQERRELAKARKWLMGMANNRVMGALVDAYTTTNNLRWDNIDLIATVMASIAGKGDDPMTDRFRADRAPVMLGTRYQRPGGVDANLVSAIIAAAITDRRLDALVELLLDEDKRRTDGAFMWAKHAEQVVLATPGGAHKWELVVSATEHLAEPRAARAAAARNYVRGLFEFLPSVMVAAVEVFDPEVARRTVIRCAESIKGEVKAQAKPFEGIASSGSGNTSPLTPRVADAFGDSEYVEHSIRRIVGGEVEYVGTYGPYLAIENLLRRTNGEEHNEVLADVAADLAREWADFQEARPVAPYPAPEKKGRETNLVARLESEFDYYMYLTGGSDERKPIRPALDYASPAKAAEAILSILGDAVTGNEVAHSIAYA